jgi:hypothetical protein
MLSFYSEIAFSLITLLVLLWGYWRSCELESEVVTDSDRYTLFTIKRRIVVKSVMASVTFISAVLVILWLDRHGWEIVGPVVVPVAMRTFSFNVIDILICVQVIWDVRAMEVGAAKKRAVDLARRQQKRRTDPHPGQPLPLCEDVR